MIFLIGYNEYCDKEVLLTSISRWKNVQVSNDTKLQRVNNNKDNNDKSTKL